MITGMQGLDRITRLLTRRLLPGLIFCLFGAGLRAEPVLLVLSDFSPSYNQVRDAVMMTAQQPPVVTTPDQLTPTDSHRGTILAVGSRACEQMLSRYHPDTRLVCSFLPSTTFVQLKRQLLPEQGQPQVSAIFIDQPLLRQIRLAKLVRPDARFLGSALGNNSQSLRSELESGSKEAGLELQLSYLTTQDNPVEKLTPVIQNSDLFLVIPDSSVFNRAISKWLLYLSLRNQVPVIGFSESYTNAGATASVHSSPTQIGQQAGEWLNRLSAGEALPPPSYPAYFDVSINTVAARTLNLKLTSGEALEQELLRLEARR
ncbi:ABC transporter substrate-binding protein [Marinobacterium sediminicola]|uniref:ABC transporter substrate binding protein n=1 Tax=Marinobacterium sediminicola TaxID=518898 RepID=A0ABY1S2L6_9GAMM|nr:ABC transporter substrate binding protein [Marinobacterium sediminicola]ULG68868.1 hypothetical protein LN244_14405 [Marinobacterium sediminicola]SMR77522.1 ABC transporter substrate binding protein [Marinobacterium sediminicola]